jgi:two-component system OmpR family sensor kinase
VDGDTRRELVRLAALACRGVERVVTDAAVASITPEPVDVLRLAQDVVAAAVLRGGNVELVPAVPVPTVMGDPARLRQALDNLVGNALVHGTSGNAVTVRVAFDDELRISVSDSGPGIDSDQLERIFEVGVRLTPDASSGSGLGLALARAIAESHGGTVTVRSAVGAGTTFTLSLPLGTD